MQLEFLQRPVAVLIRVSVFLQRPVAEIEVLEYRTRTIASCTTGFVRRNPCRWGIRHEGRETLVLRLLSPNVLRLFLPRGLVQVAS